MSSAGCSDGSQTTPSHSYGDFRFKTYAPIAFRYFRDLFHIKPADFLASCNFYHHRLDDGVSCSFSPTCNFPPKNVVNVQNKSEIAMFSICMKRQSKWIILVPLIPCLDLQRSICTEPLKELSNAGASGSIFYVSMDDQFIIKTLQHKEADFLQKLLPGYYMVT